MTTETISNDSEVLISMSDNGLQELANDHFSAMKDCDDILREIVLDGRDRPRAGETAWFKRHAQWDEPTIRKQLGRMKNVVQWQAVAGTPADREAVQQEAERAQSLLESESPKIRTQIEKLEAKLKGLERDAHSARKRADQQADAVQRLRNFVPEHVRERFLEDRSDLEHGLGRELMDSKTRQNMLQCCLDPGRYRKPQDYFSGLKINFPAAVMPDPKKVGLTYIYSPAWESIKRDIEAELAELQPKIGRLQSEYDRRTAEVEEILSYYARVQ